MNTIDADVEAVFNRLVDGIASEADEQQLGELLRASPEARRAYRELMSLHSALHWDYGAALSPKAAGDQALKSLPSISPPATRLKLDRLDFVFNAILNSDGYDLGHVHLQLTRQGHPRGGVAVAGPYDERLVGSPVPLGQWTHVVSMLSRETRSHRVYVNGVLTLERRWRTDQILRPGSCRLGNWLALEGDQVANRVLRGRVDELAIWNRNLSVDEIKKLFEIGRPGMLDWFD